MSTWFYGKGGQKQGPVSDEELRNLINSGAVGPNDLVWKEGMADWQKVSTVPGLVFSPDASGPEPVPPSEPNIPVTTASSLVGSTVPDYLPWSIAATILCCVPIGVAAIYYSIQANSARTAGNFEAARNQAQIARKWLIAAVVTGVVVGVVYLLFTMMVGLSQSVRHY
jgi:predicted secreted protein